MASSTGWNTCPVPGPVSNLGAPLSVIHGGWLPFVAMGLVSHTTVRQPQFASVQGDDFAIGYRPTTTNPILAPTHLIHG